MSVLGKMAVPVVALALVMLLAGTRVTAVQAQEPPFSAYGSGLRAGDKVEVFAGGESCGSATADTDGNWILRFASDAPCTPTDGDPLTFTLNGALTTASETFKIGGAPRDIPKGIALAGADPAGAEDAGLLAGRGTAIAGLAASAIVLIAVVGARAVRRRR